MTIWIIALLLIGVMGLLGFFLGAIRSIVVFLGVLIGGVLALPLGPTLRPLFTACGVTSTVWLWVWPPVAMFCLVYLVFLGLSFAAHYPVAKHYKFASDDVGYARWKRMNNRIGACLGIPSAVLTLFFFSAAIYGPGYLSVQLAKEEGDPFWLSSLNKARQDMVGTGLDRVGAAWDPMPKKFYPLADLAGLLYHNMPGISDRLAEYPPFMTYGERQEFSDIFNDKEFIDAISGKANLVDLAANGKVLSLLNSAEARAELSKLDLVDFRNFLDKGKSAKYDPIKVLGRWEMDPNPLIVALRKSRTDLTPADLTAIRSMAAIMASNTKLKVTTDNKFSLLMKGSLEDLKKVTAPKPVAPVRPAANAAGGGQGDQGQRLGSVSGMSANMRRRYGFAPAAPAPQPPAGEAPAEGEEGAAPKPAPAPGSQLAAITLQGGWEGEGNNYQFSLRDASGKEESIEVRVDQDTLTFTALGQYFVFYRL